MASPQHHLDRELQTAMPPPTTDPLPVNKVGEDGTNGSNNFGWTPVYLHARTLIGFAVLYLGLLLATIALAVIDNKRDGISSADSKNYYLWTFGPTAVLSIVAALWAQVEYRTKQAMPWVTLKRRSTTPASKTLLTDYITPWLLESWYCALRVSDWPVVVVITNALLIKLVTVASTGLLVLQPTLVTHHDCSLLVADNFVDSFNTSAVGAAPVLATLAIQNGTIPMPPGTSRHAAFQRLEAPFSDFADVEVEGVSKAFRGSLECEVATVKSGANSCSNWQCHGLNTTIEITTPTCNVRFNYTRGCEGGLEPVSCDFQDAWGLACDTHEEGHNKNRLVFMIGLFQQNLSGRRIRGGIVTNSTTTILCEPKYEITNVKVKMDRAGNVLTEETASIPEVDIDTFPSWDLVDGLQTSTRAAGLIVGEGFSYWSWSSAPWSAFWELFEAWNREAYSSGDLKDAETLISRASEMFSLATAQMAKASLMVPSVERQVGKCSATQSRLRVRGLSFYLMAASLLILLLLTLILIYIRPRKFSSRDPGTIGGLALILSGSPAFLSLLHGYGAADLEIIQQHLGNLECQSAFLNIGTERLFSIALTQNDHDLDTGSTSPDTPSAFTQPGNWYPISLRRSFKLFVIGYLLSVVVLLEVMYSYSQRHSGIAEVDIRGYVRFSWVYVPAIVMLSAQTLVGMIAFTLFLVYPYFLLQKRSKSTWNEALRDYISHTAVESVFRSVISRHWSVVCMAVAIMLTPLLTIAVSGLYAPFEIETRTGFSLSPQNQFNASFKPEDIFSSAAFGAGSAHVGLLLTQNFTYPLWTYDELAFPEFKMDYPGTVDAASHSFGRSNVTATLPGIRVKLNCSIAKGGPGTISGFKWFSTNTTLPAYEDVGCPTDVWPKPGSNPFGFFSLGRQIDATGLSLSNKFCGIFGLSQTNWKAFTCQATTYQFDVEVTLAASTTTILNARPIESSARFFSNETLYMGYIRLNDFPSVMVPSVFGPANFRLATAGYYDPMFQAVIHASGTTDNLANFPMEDFMKDGGFEKIASHLQHIYRTIIAQSASAIRVPLNTSSPLAPPQSINGTLHHPGTYRLRQSKVSTRILDGLLVTISLCIALSLWLMNMRKILPKNPASIAAGASILADKSDWLYGDLLPKGAQWWSDAELRDQLAWKDIVFKLGWWDVPQKSGESGETRSFGLDCRKE